MSHEYWATFSIYDHRQPHYRRALVLFDRVVMPVPTKVIGTLTEPELEQLDAEVSWLQKQGAAVRFDWDPDKAGEWQQSIAGEAFSVLLNKDKEYGTRLHLWYEAEHTLKKPDGVTVTATPVYPSRQRLEAAMSQEMFFTQQVNLEIAKEIDVPAAYAGLEYILDLRNSPGFQNAMRKFHEWQHRKLRDLLEPDAPPTAVAIQEAVDEFNGWLADYEKEMLAAKFDKARATLVSVLQLGSALLSIHQGLVGDGAAVLDIGAKFAEAGIGLNEVVRPSWKKVAEKECAPAGVVYEARQHFG